MTERARGTEGLASAMGEGAFGRSTVAMISAACAQLGERALIWSAPNDSTHIPHVEHVNVMKTIGQAGIFPLCRIVVHHGGADTTPQGYAPESPP